MKEHPQAKIILAGHTDNIGTWDYNMKLSHRRAASVRTYLVEKCDRARSNPVAPKQRREDL